VLSKLKNVPKHDAVKKAGMIGLPYIKQKLRAKPALNHIGVFVKEVLFSMGVRYSEKKITKNIKREINILGAFKMLLFVRVVIIY
jgi:uncharacterized protein YneF (UPF0154 family)